MSFCPRETIQKPLSGPYATPVTVAAPRQPGLLNTAALADQFIKAPEASAPPATPIPSLPHALPTTLGQYLRNLAWENRNTRKWMSYKEIVDKLFLAGWETNNKKPYQAIVYEISRIRQDKSPWVQKKTNNDGTVLILLANP